MRPDGRSVALQSIRNEGKDQEEVERVLNGRGDLGVSDSFQH